MVFPGNYYSLVPLALALFVICAWVRFRLCNQRRLPLPPGPTGFPIVGNVRNIPKIFPWLTYEQWGKQYGEIIYVEVMGQSIVILNSARAITELLERRSYNYSDRTPMCMANDLTGWDWDFAHMRYGSWWRSHRKTFHQYFNPNAVRACHPVQEECTRTFLQLLLDSPDRWLSHTRYFSGAVATQVAYGRKLDINNDYYIDLAARAAEGLREVASMGAYLVDFLPMLKYIPSWLPGASFKKKAQHWRKAALEIKNVPFERFKAQKVPSQCFCASSLENQSAKCDTRQEEIVKNCAGMIYVAGSESTAATLMSFVLAMILYPEVQKRAQAEVDDILRGDRLPDWSDRPRMPYIQCIISEVLRWIPVTPLAVAHASIQEDEYEGYRIPAGSAVLGNAWAVLHDENMYPDPMQFKPERFERKQGQIIPMDPRAVAFGYGRRICPGRHLAGDSIWMAIVSILCTFDLSKAVGPDGHEITPQIAFSSGLTSHPLPFACTIAPRSARAAALIKEDSHNIIP